MNSDQPAPMDPTEALTGIHKIIDLSSQYMNIALRMGGPTYTIQHTIQQMYMCNCCAMPRSRACTPYHPLLDVQNNWH